MLGGLVLSVPAPTPSPDRFTRNGETGPVLIIESCPEAVPEDVGTNISTNVVDWPPAKVTGSDRLLTVNPTLIVSLCTVTDAVPVLVRVTVMAFELPTGTLWKLGLAGGRVNTWVWASAVAGNGSNELRARSANRYRRQLYWGRVRISPRVCLLG